MVIIETLARASANTFLLRLFISSVYDASSSFSRFSMTGRDSIMNLLWSERGLQSNILQHVHFTHTSIQVHIVFESVDLFDGELDYSTLTFFR